MANADQTDEILDPNTAREILSTPGPVTPARLRAANYVEMLGTMSNTRLFYACDVVFVLGVMVLSGMALFGWLFAYAALQIYNVQCNTVRTHRARLYAAADLGPEAIDDAANEQSHSIVSIASLYAGAALVLTVLPLHATRTAVALYAIWLIYSWFRDTSTRARAAATITAAKQEAWYAGYTSVEDQRNQTIAQITLIEYAQPDEYPGLPPDPFDGTEI
jgi:hypothetical protein